MTPDPREQMLARVSKAIVEELLNQQCLVQHGEVYAGIYGAVVMRGVAAAAYDAVLAEQIK